MAITTLLGEAKSVADSKDNTIYIEGGLKLENGQPRHFREIGPMLFRSVDGPEKIAIVKDSGGQRVGYIDYSFIGIQPIERPLGKKIFNYVVICICIAVIVPAN